MVSTGDGEAEAERLSYGFGQRGESVLDAACPSPRSLASFTRREWDGFSQDEPHSFCASEDTSLLSFFFEQSLYLSHFTHLFIQLETYQDSLSYPPSCHGIVEPAKIDLCSYDPISLQIPWGLIVRELIKPQPSSLKTYWRPNAHPRALLSQYILPRPHHHTYLTYDYLVHPHV